jgi:hypothetical protein
MKRILGFLALLVFATTAFGATPVLLPNPIHLPIKPLSTSYTSLVSCQGWIPTSPEFGLTVEAYAHSAQASASTVSDAQGLVTEVRQTTNNFFNRSAESANVSRATDAHGITEFTIDTTAFADCSLCYTLKVTNGTAGAGRILTGSIQFAGSTTSYPLDCGTLY